MAGRISKIRERIARNRERLQARIEADIQKSEEQLKQANLVYERTIEEHLQRRLGREWRKGLSVYLDHVSHEDPEKGSCLVVRGLDDGMRKLILTGAEEDEIFDLSENVGKAEKVQEKAEMVTVVFKKFLIYHVV